MSGFISAASNKRINTGEKSMKLALNEKLLDVLLAIYRKRLLAQVEASIGLIDAVENSVKEYIKSLPDVCIEGVGLKRNTHCFRELMVLDVPSVWLETEASSLSNFSFSYPG